MFLCNIFIVLWLKKNNFNWKIRLHVNIPTVFSAETRGDIPSPQQHRSGLQTVVKIYAPVILISECDRNEKRERWYLTEESSFQKTCQNMPSYLDAQQSGPSCFCCVAFDLRQQITGKFIQWRNWQETAGVRIQWKRYEIDCDWSLVVLCLCWNPNWKFKE